MHPDTAIKARHRIAADIKESISLFPILRRKPKIMRHWLLSAHTAQIIVIALIILVPLVLIPSFDYLLEQIFRPVTKKVLFGLVNKQSTNPYLDGAQLVTASLIWAAAVLTGIYLYLRHIPRTIAYAKHVVKSNVASADRLIVQKPSESIMLYNAAREWSTDDATDTLLSTKLDEINATLHPKQYSANATLHLDNDKTAILPAQTVVIPAPVKTDSNIIIADRYRIKNKLGSGAMGIVYVAEDLRLKRDVALKQLSPQFAAEETVLARFRQEALALARLSHPNIVQVYDYIEGNGFFWIVMELIAGEELAERLKSVTMFPLNDALMLSRKMADALGYAHERGVIHRDFKLANVLITPSGEIKITDFGIAKLAQSSIHTQINSVMGSPAYMSPEQASGSETDQRTDIYALGVVMYQMISGELPFTGDARAVIAQHLTKTPPLLRDKQPDIAPGIDDIIQKMLAKEPQDRYQSMAEVVNQLDSHLK